MRTLQAILNDLIEGQGNLAVVIDLAEATVTSTPPSMFMAVGFRAARGGTSLVVKDPPQETVEALRSSEWANVIKFLPRADTQ